jgi:hypothetical protein
VISPTFDVPGVVGDVIRLERYVRESPETFVDARKYRLERDRRREGAYIAAARKRKRATEFLRSVEQIKHEKQIQADSSDEILLPRPTDVDAVREYLKRAGGEQIEKKLVGRIREERKRQVKEGTRPQKKRASRKK